MAKKCKVICILKASSKIYDQACTAGESRRADRIRRKHIQISAVWAEVKASW